MTFRTLCPSLFWRLLVLMLCWVLLPASVAGRKVRAVPPKKLLPGQPITQWIWKEMHLLFDGKVGEVVTLKVTGKTPGIDPHVALLDPDDDKEAFDDDSGGHGNSLISNHTLKQSGRYTVIVELAGSDGGYVEILLKKAKPPGYSARRR